jgi:hypothetical protein
MATTGRRPKPKPRARLAQQWAAPRLAALAKLAV